MLYMPSSKTAPSMKLIWLPTTELWKILAVYIMWPCDFDLWPFDPKIDARNQNFVLNAYAIF